MKTIYSMMAPGTNRYNSLLAWSALIFLVILALTGCNPAPGAVDPQTNEEAGELPAIAQSYIEMSRAALAEQLGTDIDTIKLESITEPATADEAFIIRLTMGEQMYEFHGRDDEVMLVSDSLPPVVYSTADLVAGLEAVGATIALNTEPEPAADIFSVPGELIHIGNEEIQVYVYDTVQAASADANRVSPTGSEIGAGAEGGSVSTVDWVSTPHFYQFGNLLVLYVGEDETTISLLESVMDAPFAGG